jgi:virulence-associated protein VapD
MSDNGLQSATCYREVIRVLNAQGFFKDQFSVYTNQNTTVVHALLVVNLLKNTIVWFPALCNRLRISISAPALELSWFVQFG